MATSPLFPESSPIFIPGSVSRLCSELPPDTPLVSAPYSSPSLSFFPCFDLQYLPDESLFYASFPLLLRVSFFFSLPHDSPPFSFLPVPQFFQERVSRSSSAPDTLIISPLCLTPLWRYRIFPVAIPFLAGRSPSLFICGRLL